VVGVKSAPIHPNYSGLISLFLNLPGCIVQGHTFKNCGIVYSYNGHHASTKEAANLKSRGGRMVKPVSIDRETLTEEQIEQVRVRAYALYEGRGGADGHDVEDWLQAKHEVLTGKLSKAQEA
jgi:hypothetical protein